MFFSISNGRYSVYNGAIFMNIDNLNSVSSVELNNI